MRKVKLIDKKNKGLFPSHTSIGPVTYEVRATIPVIEALEKAGTVTTPLLAPRVGYKIVLGDRMPAGIIAVHLNADAPERGLRLDSEEEYPQEFPDYWAQVDFTPCPVCQAPVVWYEAGFVPGYRVCTKKPHHHSLAQ